MMKKDQIKLLLRNLRPVIIVIFLVLVAKTPISKGQDLQFDSLQNILSRFDNKRRSDQ